MIRGAAYHYATAGSRRTWAFVPPQLEASHLSVAEPARPSTEPPLEETIENGPVYSDTNGDGTLDLRGHAGAGVAGPFRLAHHPMLAWTVRTASDHWNYSSHPRSLRLSAGIRALPKFPQCRAIHLTKKRQDPYNLPRQVRCESVRLPQIIRTGRYSQERRIRPPPNNDELRQPSEPS